MADPPVDWIFHLQRWQNAGLIDSRAADSIARWEQLQRSATHPDVSHGLVWSGLVCLAGGWGVQRLRRRLLSPREPVVPKP